MPEPPMSKPMVIESHSGPYQVNFEQDALEVLDRDVPESAHFIIDSRVAEIYRGRMANILAAPSVLLIEARENAKSLEKFPAYVDHLVTHRVRRDHVLIAIGGGIIQDVTCFLSATLLRGIDWRFLPTTLLAQADSCIGSKSSINCGNAKNILGTFTPPREVFIATKFLETLDERDVRSGVGEMMKVHAIESPEAFDRIAGDYARLFTDPETMQHYVRRALEVKKSYIEPDEFDRRERQVFNYGHSFGHAIEAATDFAIPHGIAVTIGMDMANYASMRLEVGSESHFIRMHPALRANYRGFEDHSVPAEKFMAAIAKDKKNTDANSVSLILPGRDGRIAKGAYPNDEIFQGICADYLDRGRAA